MAAQFYVGNTSRPLRVTLTVNDLPQDLTGATAKFYMRPASSDVLKVNGSNAVVDTPASDGKVHYDWAPGDVDTAGEYVGWFQITLGGKTQDTPDIAISIGGHGELITPTPAGTGWPTREWLEAVSDQDWSGVNQDQFEHWSRSTVAEMCQETGQVSAYFDGLDTNSTERIVSIEIWQLMMERRMIQRRADVQESTFDDSYQSFSAGPYSESKPAMKERNPLYARMVTPSFELSRKLYLLMTPEMQMAMDAAAGLPIAMEIIQEVDWFDSPYNDWAPLMPGGWWP